MNEVSRDILMHYGVKRRSGRYPWGSGENPYQHSGDFLARVAALKSDGLSESKIAEQISKDIGKEFTTTDLRAYSSIANNQRRALEVDRIKSLQKDGLNTSEIARRMGKNESSIRSLLNPESEARMNKSLETAKILKKEIDSKGIIDVGAGVERELGVSKEKLKEALVILEAEGYMKYGMGVRQVTNKNQQTTLTVICPPGTKYKDVYEAANNDKIGTVRDYRSKDGGRTFEERVFRYPSSIDSKRVQIRYKEDGGIDKDGVIELRRGVDDISLGNASYAQVRILVDGDRYMKGMAMYSDDIPDGVDIIFNTNKSKDVAKRDVLKKITSDPDNPFGSYISPEGQSTYFDKKGKEQLSAINKVREEGQWDTWSKTLSSQFLAKQNMPLIKKQLKLTYDGYDQEYSDILALENPTVRKKLLMDFADNCDSASADLKAAALPRQSSRVILPVNSLRDDEIYAPTYNNGEQVALVRYPHEGTFEIPILTVNNKHKEAKSLLGNSKDAVGININVAGKLSGADFDGDSVVVIPTNSNVKIKSTTIKELESFEPKDVYAYDSIRTEVKKNGEEVEYATRNGIEYKVMSEGYKQTQMGIVSNLITDMTLRGATTEELTRATKHSMVVIDAAKHKLDYKASYKDNGIAELKQKYQLHTNENGKEVLGASTLISRASSEIQVPKRKGSPDVNIMKETGKKVYKLANETYIDDKGNEVLRTQKSKQMYEVDDARKLSSGTAQEEAYANYANHMKTLALEARKEAMATKPLAYSPAAKQKYKAEYDSLNAKLEIAELNAPRERQAQIIANSVAKAKKQANPDMTSDQYKKIEQQALNTARVSVGATGKQTRIKITPLEWEAIQSGAISDSKLSKILAKSDMDEVRKLATPRESSELSNAKQSRIASMSASGYTIAEIAAKLGVSTSTVSKYLK